MEVAQNKYTTYNETIAGKTTYLYLVIQVMPLKQKKDIPKSSSFTAVSSICALCHEIQNANSAEICACGHGFHHDCIKRWLNNNEQCPICNFIL